MERVRVPKKEFWGRKIKQRRSPVCLWSVSKNPLPLPHAYLWSKIKHREDKGENFLFNLVIHIIMLVILREWVTLGRISLWECFRDAVVSLIGCHVVGQKTRSKFAHKIVPQCNSTHLTMANKNRAFLKTPQHPLECRLNLVFKTSQTLMSLFLFSNFSVTYRLAPRRNTSIHVV